jgi:hypothetical protein
MCSELSYKARGALWRDLMPLLAATLIVTPACAWIDAHSRTVAKPGGRVRNSVALLWLQPGMKWPPPL